MKIPFFRRPKKDRLEAAYREIRRLNRRNDELSKRNARLARSNLALTLASFDFRGQRNVNSISDHSRSAAE